MELIQSALIALAIAGGAVGLIVVWLKFDKDIKAFLAKIGSGVTTQDLVNNLNFIFDMAIGIAVKDAEMKKKIAGIKEYILSAFVLIEAKKEQIRYQMELTGDFNLHLYHEKLTDEAIAIAKEMTSKANLEYDDGIWFVVRNVIKVVCMFLFKSNPKPVEGSVQPTLINLQEPGA